MARGSIQCAVVFAVLLLSTLVSGLAQAMEKSFSGTCTSQGAYTTAAFAQAKELHDTLQRLKNDPACKDGIQRLSETIQNAYEELKQYRDPTNPEKAGAPNSSSMATLPGEISSLYNYLRESGSANTTGVQTSGKLSGLARQGLASKVIDLMTQKVSSQMGNLSILGQVLPVEDWSSMKLRLRRTSYAGLSYLDTAFQIIPEMKQCVAERPDEMLTVIGAGIGMIGAFAGSEEGGTTRLARTLLRFVTFMREMKFASVQANLKKIEYWNSISCLLESTTEAYCSNRDARVIQKSFSNAHMDVELARKHMDEKSDSPLFGYYLLNRELPTISYWIQQIQMGTDPKQTVETNLRNKTIETLTTLIKSIFTAKGFFNERMIYYQDLTDHRAKMNFMVDLVNQISNQLAMGGGDVNFFTQVVNSQYLPYYLIGLDGIPPEVLPSRDNNLVAPKSFDVWALGDGGNMQPIFHQPDRLSATIRQRLWNILDQSLVLGSRYFRRFFNPDTAFLATAAGVDPNLTVYQSILNIEAYLVHLHKKFAKDPQRHGLILPAIADTVDRFNRVRVSFYNVKKLSKEIAELDLQNLQTSIARMSKDQKRQWEYAYSELLTRTYTEFNILLQRDTFIANRLSTFVLYDFSERIRSKEALDPHMEDLMRVAGRNLHDRLYDFMGTNPTLLYQDVNNAATILRETLDGYEEFFGNEFFKMITYYHRKAGGDIRRRNELGFGPDIVIRGRNEDTPERAYDQARAKFCVQSLAFKNWRRYHELCAGAVLYSQPNQEYFDQVQKTPESKGTFWDWLLGRTPPTEGGANRVSAAGGAKTGPKPETGVASATIDLNYDKLVELRLKNDRSTSVVRDGQICLLKQFYRESQVFWLTRKFDKGDDSHMKEVAEIEEENLRKERELERQLAEQEAQKPTQPGANKPPVNPMAPGLPGVAVSPDLGAFLEDPTGLGLNQIGKILKGPLLPWASTLTNP